MSGVGGHPDVFGIGEFHDSADVFLPFHGSPDMRMRRQPYPHLNRLLADFVERVRKPLELIIARTAWRTLAHIDLPMVAVERMEKITSEGHMIGDGFRDAVWIDEIRGLALFAIGRIDERNARIVEDPFELQRILPVLFNLIAVWLDALYSQGR